MAIWLFALLWLPAVAAYGFAIEYVVNGISYQLVQVMRDNLVLLDFVGEVFGHRPKPLSDAFEVVTGEYGAELRWKPGVLEGTAV